MSIIEPSDAERALWSDSTEAYVAGIEAQLEDYRKSHPMATAAAMSACGTLREKVRRLETEIETWKDATGLECGGDPGGVTPAMMRAEWDKDIAAREKAEAECRRLSANLASMARRFGTPCEPLGAPPAAKPRRMKANSTENYSIHSTEHDETHLCAHVVPCEPVDAPATREAGK